MRPRLPQSVPPATLIACTVLIGVTGCAPWGGENRTRAGEHAARGSERAVDPVSTRRHVAGRWLDELAEAARQLHPPSAAIDQQRWFAGAPLSLLRHAAPFPDPILPSAWIEQPELIDLPPPSAA